MCLFKAAKGYLSVKGLNTFKAASIVAVIALFTVRLPTAGRVLFFTATRHAVGEVRLTTEERNADFILLIELRMAFNTGARILRTASTVFVITYWKSVDI